MSTEHLQIKKVKLTKQGRLEIKYIKKEADNSSSEVEEKHSSKAHKDFTDALDKMRIHLAMLFGFMKPTEVKDPVSYMTGVGDYHVQSFSIGGEDEDQGIVISGYRILPSGKAAILNTPFTRFNEDEATRYKHMDALLKVVAEVREETVKYMGGKFEEDAQLSLNLGNPVQEEALK